MKTLFLSWATFLFCLNIFANSFIIQGEAARKIYKKFNVEEKISENSWGAIKEGKERLYCIKEKYSSRTDSYRCELGDNILDIDGIDAKNLYIKMSSEEFREITYSWKATYGTLQCEGSAPLESEIKYLCRFNY